MITSAIVVDGPSNPLLKTVAQVRGHWFANFATYKWMMLAPALAIVGPLLAIMFTVSRKAGLAFVASAIGIFGVISTAGVSMFPFLMPSDIMPQASLTVWDATSSQLTLFVMLLATLIFLPIVLAYTGFAFRVMRGVVTAKRSKPIQPITTTAGNALREQNRCGISPGSLALVLPAAAAFSMPCGMIINCRTRRSKTKRKNDAA